MTLLRTAITITALSICACSFADDVETAALVKQCTECHTEKGIAGIPGWPDIAGMEQDDIVAKLKGHRAGVIADSTMRKVAVELTDKEIHAVAKHFSKLK